MKEAQELLQSVGVDSTAARWSNPTMNTLTERTIASFMRESDDAPNTGDVANADAGGGVANADGDDPALHGEMDSPDARIAQSELSHIFSDLMEPDGAPPEGAPPEAEPIKKVSTHMTVRGGCLPENPLRTQKCTV